MKYRFIMFSVRVAHVNKSWHRSNSKFCNNTKSLVFFILLERRSRNSKHYGILYQLSFQEIPVEFEAFPPNEEDFNGIRCLLQQVSQWENLAWATKAQFRHHAYAVLNLMFDYSMAETQLWFRCSVNVVWNSAFTEAPLLHPPQW